MKRWLPLAALSAAPAWGAQVDDDESGSAVDPNSPCPSAKPQSPQCCFNSTAVVAGGVDFVDLAGKTQGKDAPAFGNASHTTTLNGYTFHFTSDANRAAFDADPWTFAPAWGGF